MTKKLISLLLVGLMVLALAPMGAFAKAEGKKVNPNMMEKFVPNKASNVVTRDEIINDGSIINEGFEASSFATGWWKYPSTSNNYNWQPVSGTYAYEGNYCAMSRSYYNGTSNASDNWLMTPEFTPVAGTNLSFYAKSQDPSYPDSMQVLIAVKGSGAYNSAHTTVVESKWTTLLPLTAMAGEYTQYHYDLSSYANQIVTVAFRHKSTDMFYLCLDKVQVGVAQEAIVETSITLDQSTLALTVGETAQLTATIAPANATFQDITWSVSDPTILGVNKIGGVMGLAEGTATVTATSHSGLTATCTVTVTAGNPFAEDMIAYGVSGTTWYNIDQYGYLEAIQVSADSDFIVRGEYNGDDGLIYAYVLVNNNYQFVTYDPANNYAKTTIGTVTEIPLWMAYAWDAGVMLGGYEYDDGEMYTGMEICTIDLTTGEKGDLFVDVFNATYEYEDDDGNTQTEQYYLMPYVATYIGSGYVLAYDVIYDSIIAYDLASEEFGAYILAENVEAQTGDFQGYVQKMWYNPNDGYIYWAGVFDTLDYIIVDIENGILAKAGITATDTNYDELTVLYAPYEITVEPEGLPGDVDCNGEVTMADVTILAMYLNGENPEITEQGMINADANQDGTVDIRDIAAIYAIISAS